MPPPVDPRPDASLELDVSRYRPPVACTAEDAPSGVLRPVEANSAHAAVDLVILDRTKRLRERLDVLVSSRPDDLHGALSGVVRFSRTGRGDVDFRVA